MDYWQRASASESVLYENSMSDSIYFPREQNLWSFRTGHRINATSTVPDSLSLRLIRNDSQL